MNGKQGQSIKYCLELKGQEVVENHGGLWHLVFVCASVNRHEHDCVISKTSKIILDNEKKPDWK